MATYETWCGMSCYPETEDRAPLHRRTCFSESPKACYPETEYQCRDRAHLHRRTFFSESPKACRTKNRPSHQTLAKKNAKPGPLSQQSRVLSLFTPKSASRFRSSDIDHMHEARGWFGPGAKTNEDVAWPHGQLWQTSGAFKFETLPKTRRVMDPKIHHTM
jgi:hypothetical protein